MPPLNTFEKTLIALTIAHTPLLSSAATIPVSAGCSLQDAISSANTSSSVGGCTAGVGGVNTIELPANETIVLTAASIGDSGLPLIDSDITIQGNGASIERSSTLGTAEFGIFTTPVGSDNILRLKDLTIRNGARSYGGAIYLNHESSLFLDGVNLLGNKANGYGGAIYAYGTATVEINNSSISDNSSAYKGGGIWAGLSHLSSTTNFSIHNTTISNNVAGDGYPGGGVGIYRGDDIVVSNSTISNNTAAGGAALYMNAAKVAMTNTTISHNRNTGFNGGVDIAGNENFKPSLRLTNTVIANSSNDMSADLDCSTNYGLNSVDNPMSLIANASWIENNSLGCAVGVTVQQGDPKLGVLSNNGGDTKTHAPRAGSGLLGAGDGFPCALPPINGLDQIGEARGAPACSIGAVENPESGNIFVVPLGQNKAVIFEL